MDNRINYLKQEISFYINSLFRRKAKTILFYPEYPHRRTIIYKILRHLKYSITNNPKHKFDLAFSWEDATFRKSQPLFNKFAPEKVINLNCKDISKEYISGIFKKKFGYSIEIDPTSYTGECVKKNNLNAKHDGIILKCPVNETEEGFVYQKVLNNKIDEKTVLDIRVPVLKGEIPFLFLKYKRIEERFTNDTFKSEIANLNEYLTEDEIKAIKKFCDEIGLDYGELDIIRNNDDRKIYIVDVNYTPWGPPDTLSEEEKRKAVFRMAEEFKRIFLAE